MQLQELKIKNLASLLGEHSLNFRDFAHAPLFAITGETGSGKSTLLNAISLALFGRVYKKNLIQTDLVTLGEREASVELTFKVSGKTYLAYWNTQVRKKNGDLLSTPRTDRFLYELNGHDIQKRILEINAEEVLRLNFDQFCKCVILNQGEFSRFLGASFTDRKEILERLYPGEVLDQLSYKAKEKVDIVVQEMKWLEVEVHTLEKGQSVDLVEVAKELEKITAKEKELKEELSFLIPIIHTSKELLSLSERYQTNLARLKELFTKIAERTNLFNLSLTEWGKQKELTQEKQKTFQIDLPILEEGIKRAKLLGETKLKRQEAGRWLAKYQQDAHQKNLRLSQINEEKSQLPVPPPDTPSNWAKRKQKLNEDIQTLLDQKSKWQHQILQYEQKQKEYDELQRKLKLLESTISPLEKDLLEHKRRAETMQWALGLYEFKQLALAHHHQTPFTDCPLCKTTLSAEKWMNQSQDWEDQSVQFAKDEHFQLKTKITNLEGPLQETRHNVSYTQKEVERLKLQLLSSFTPFASIDILKVEQLALGKKLDALESERHGILELEKNQFKWQQFESEIARLRQEQDTLQAQIALAQKTVYELDAQIAQIELELFSKFKSQNPEDLLLEQREKLYSQEKNEEKNFREFKQRELELKEIESRRYALEEQLKEIEKIFSTTLFQFSEMEKVKTSFGQIQLTMDETPLILKPLLQKSQEEELSTQKLFQEVIEEKSKLKTLQAESLKNQEQKDIIHKRLNGLNQEKREAQEIYDLIGRDELRSFTLALVEDALINETNNQLNKLCSGRYEIIHQTKKLKMSPDFYVIDKYRDGLTRKVSTLSGGETFMVSVAMALSLAEMTRGQANIDSFFIDEGFGTLDEDSLNDVLEMLQQLQSRGKQIGIISHIKALTTRLPLNIQLVKNRQGHSSIELVNL